VSSVSLLLVTLLRLGTESSREAGCCGVTPPNYANEGESPGPFQMCRRGHVALPGLGFAVNSPEWWISRGPSRWPILAVPRGQSCEIRQAFLQVEHGVDSVQSHT
jgi:hypothetical protein